MQAHFKRLLLSIATLGLILSPLAASAVSGNTSSEPKRQSGMTGFCVRVGNVKSELTTKLNQLETNRGSKRAEILDNLQKRKRTQADEIQEKREGLKTDFSERIGKLRAKYTTVADSAAIAAFKASVDSALATRKSAVDAAVAAYKTAVTQLVTTRQDGIKTAAAAFKSAVSAANTKAAADCAAGIDPTTVRTALMNSIKAANQQFRTDVRALDKIGSQIETAAKTRNDAIKDANRAFKASVKLAGQTLKAALGPGATPTPVPTPTPTSTSTPTPSESEVE